MTIAQHPKQNGNIRIKQNFFVEVIRSLERPYY